MIDLDDEPDDGPEVIALINMGYAPHKSGGAAFALLLLDHRRDVRDTFIRILGLLLEKTPAAEVVPLPTAESEPPHGKSKASKDKPESQDKAAE